jgi:hypothetical protein
VGEPVAATTRLAHATDSLRAQIAALIRDERYAHARALLVGAPAVTGDRELLLLSAVVHLRLTT